MKKLTLLFACLFTALSTRAQGLENSLYTNGKIYIVVGVIAIIFIGIILYLIRMEKKIKRLEEKVNNESIAG